jgi:hypothetical protein
MQAVSSFDKLRPLTHISVDHGEMTRCGRSPPWSTVALAAAFRPRIYLNSNFVKLARPDFLKLALHLHRTRAF